jgi:hypothetical protein
MRLKAHDPRSKHIKLDTLLTEHGSVRPAGGQNGSMRSDLAGGQPDRHSGEIPSDFDPNPIRRATVTEVSNKTADTHDKIKAGDQDTGTGILLRPIRLLILSVVCWLTGI